MVSILASRLHDRGIKMWNVHTGDLLRTCDKSVELWDLNTGVLLITFNRHRDKARGVAFDRHRMLAS